MNYLEENCFFTELSDEVVAQCLSFNCGDDDLDDFFSKDTSNYKREMLGKSYCLRLKNDSAVIVCAFTLSNSGLDVRHLPGSRKKKLNEVIPREKHLSSYPAALIGRLAVSENFSGKGIGKELMLMIQGLAVDDDNKFACRFLTVDAYNNEATRKFYEKNGFIYLFTSEQQEKSYIGMPDDKILRTRLMYFDLLRGF
ncbi:MAG: hypothetical protein EZS26_002326 [Candidatus Ordinivivax streblomastigis]|jgi:GNAT superfamily N-acetyltransferase|uniref:N-acetyltransferase domain-containing protein n=1 Tax=Candidatus Ordinivivax streblomastigis TaxID=2540710 RepID=A0A5M8NZL0_9BACT|nr:MAG: hypothetical protein EZS26_002326 [Candidatus Ordinivivax streblomastigis]